MCVGGQEGAFPKHSPMDSVGPARSTPRTWAAPDAVSCTQVSAGGNLSTRLQTERSPREHKPFGANYIGERGKKKLKTLRVSEMSSMELSWACT